MDLRKVKKLIELVQESGIAELEVSSGEESVRIALYAGQTGQPAATVPAAPAVPAAVVASTSAHETHAIKAPMAGTFYSAPDPESEPYVQVGSEVAVGDVICIIESMKMMHEIKAAEAGTVTQICVANATPISTGADLILLS